MSEDGVAEARFGPGWRGVVRVVGQAKTLTREQVLRVPAWSAVDTEWITAWRAARAAGLGWEWERAFDAAWDTASVAAFAAIRAAGIGGQDAARNCAWQAANVAGLAAAAAVVADLAERHVGGLTLAHIDTLTQSWRVLIGIKTQGER